MAKLCWTRSRKSGNCFLRSKKQKIASVFGTPNGTFKFWCRGMRGESDESFPDENAALEAAWRRLCSTQQQ